MQRTARASPVGYHCSVGSFLLLKLSPPPPWTPSFFLPRYLLPPDPGGFLFSRKSRRVRAPGSLGLQGPSDSATHCAGVPRGVPPFFRVFSSVSNFRLHLRRHLPFLTVPSLPHGARGVSGFTVGTSVTCPGTSRTTGTKCGCHAQSGYSPWGFVLLPGLPF